MKINLSGHHVELTDHVRADFADKFAKIKTHFSTLVSIDATIGKEQEKFIVEVHANYEGVKVSATGQDDVMYPAISQAAKKLDAALKHRKGQLKSNLHSKPECTTAPIAHEIVQEMKLV